MAVLPRTALKIFLIMCAISLAYSKDEEEKKKRNVTCVEMTMNGEIHNETLMINGVDRPYQLSYYKRNKTDEIIFFSYNIGLQNESTFEIGFSENGYAVPVPLKQVKNGFATAVNREEHLIYLGGSDGIHVHNLTATNNQTELLIPKHDIWDLFYKDSLYFINYPSRRLYKYHSGKSVLQKHIHEKIYHFVIDGDGDTFINNKTGVYMIGKDSKRRIHMKGPKVFRAIEVNRKGVAHFCGQNEVYVADKEKHKFDEIVKIKNVFGLTFDDDDHLIYSDPHQIVKLQRGKCEKKTKEKKSKKN